MLNILRWILLPFSIVYGLITFVRNKLYDYKLIQSSSFDLPIICIGNLSVGGTGKTPHIEYVANLLKNNLFKPAVLSRGYGRKSIGYVLAEPHIDAELIGDEPAQIFSNLIDTPVAVCENRVIGVTHLLYDAPETNVVLLDDAFQHRSIKAGLNIIITTHNNPYYNDFIMPVGSLREFSMSKKRANAIIVSKCPDVLSEKEIKEILAKLKPLPHQKIFFSKLTYGNIHLLQQPEKIISPDKDNFIYCFAGIASTQKIKEYIQTLSKHYFVRKLPDHVTYSSTLIKSIINDFNLVEHQNKILLTTQKDAVKLMHPKVLKLFDGYDIYVLPVKVSFFEPIEFEKFILQYVSANN
ncbi:MAG: tetraacyldisaccharide 4'-kinase [Bacteroidia bacterium]